MQKNRIDLIALAIQGGATIDNAHRVAEDWGNWAREGQPVTKLATPNYDAILSESSRRSGPATVAYCDIEPDWKEVQRNFLKKYGQELTFVKSGVSLHGFSETGHGFEMRLEPVEKQGKLFYAEEEKEGLRGYPAKAAEDVQGKAKGQGNDPKGTGGRRGREPSDGVRLRAGGQQALLFDPCEAVRDAGGHDDTQEGADEAFLVRIQGQR